MFLGRGGPDVSCTLGKEVGIPIAMLHTCPPAHPLQAPKRMMHAMASCHAVTHYEGQLLGNEVEVNMFRATGWTLVETHGKLPQLRSPGPAAETLETIRRFEFDHARTTMSVAVAQGAEVVGYVKGSFEKIAQVWAGAWEGVSWTAVHLVVCNPSPSWGY